MLMEQQNPFFHRGPIHNPNFFFGRAQEVHQACELLRMGQHQAISGPRRFGKTSLLFHLENPAIRAEYGIEHVRWVYLDGGTLDGLDDEWLYGAINQALDGDRDAIPYNRFVDLVRRVTANGHRLVIALDEFELLAANVYLGVTVFNRLRGLTNQFPIQFITASKNPLSNISFVHSDTLSSPFFNIFSPMRLTAFAETEAVDLLMTLSEIGGQPFSEDTVNFIIQLVGCHPLFLQIAGYHSFVLQDQGHLSPKACTEVERRVKLDLDGHLQYYWNSLDKDSRYLLAAFPFVNAEASSPAWQKLQQSGLQSNNTRFSWVAQEFAQHQNVPSLLRVGPFLVDNQRGLVAIHNQPVHLTNTEFATLQLFLENPGQLIALEEIEAVLWPEEIAIDPERARGAIKKLRAALGEAGDVIVNRRGQGYLLILD